MVAEGVGWVVEVVGLFWEVCVEVRMCVRVKRRWVWGENKMSNIFVRGVEDLWKVRRLVLGWELLGPSTVGN